MSRRLDLRHAGKIGLKHIAAEPVGDELAIARRVDEARGLQLLHMVGDSGSADLGASAQVLARQRVAGLADLAQEVIAARIGQRPGDQVKAIVGELSQRPYLMLERFVLLLDSHKLENADLRI